MASQDRSHTGLPEVLRKSGFPTSGRRRRRTRPRYRKGFPGLAQLRMPAQRDPFEVLLSGRRRRPKRRQAVFGGPEFNRPLHDRNSHHRRAAARNPGCLAAIRIRTSAFLVDAASGPGIFDMGRNRVQTEVVPSLFLQFPGKRPRCPARCPSVGRALSVANVFQSEGLPIWELAVAADGGFTQPTSWRPGVQTARGRLPR